MELIRSVFNFIEIRLVQINIYANKYTQEYWNKNELLHFYFSFLSMKIAVGKRIKQPYNVKVLKYLL